MFTHAMLLEGCHSTKCVCVCCEVSVLQIKRPSDGKKGEASDVTKAEAQHGRKQIGLKVFLPSSGKRFDYLRPICDGAKEGD